MLDCFGRYDYLFDSFIRRDFIHYIEHCVLHYRTQTARAGVQRYRFIGYRFKRGIVEFQLHAVEVEKLDILLYDP